MICVICHEACRALIAMPDGRKVRVHTGWCMSEYILIDRLLSRSEIRKKLEAEEPANA